MVDYAPFVDLDKNGVIIVTLVSAIEEFPNAIILLNISAQFKNGWTGDLPDPERMVKVCFKNPNNGIMSTETVNGVVRQIESLYANEIDALWFQNLPNTDYTVLVGGPIPEDAEILQWDWQDLCRLKEHIRMLYDPTVSTPH
jgi:hypothetical protein